MHLVSYYFIKRWGGLIANTLVWSQGDQCSIPFTNIYYVEYIYIYIYLVYVCFWNVVQMSHML
jgi:hypothetical protein